MSFAHCGVKGRHRKIIVLSGQLSKTEILSAAKLMGADLVIPEPVAIETLLQAVTTLAESSRP
ncbi:MAG: hypothetical protein QM771_16210 [Nitrospira sp.]